MKLRSHIIGAVALLLAALPAAAQSYQPTLLNAVTANTACVGVVVPSDTTAILLHITSASTSTADVTFQQSLDNSRFGASPTTVSNPTSTGKLWIGPPSPYICGVVTNRSAGTITMKANFLRTPGANPGGWKELDTMPSGVASDVTDGFVFIPAWTACVATTPSATLVATRAAANDYNLTRVAAGAETYSISCSLGSWLQRSTASKGVKITSVKVVHQITVAALTSNSAPTIKTVTYANNTANALANFGGTLTVTMPTATQTNPYVTTVGLGTPAFFSTADSDLTIDWTAVMQNTGVYAVQGIIVGFQHTVP